MFLEYEHGQEKKMNYRLPAFFFYKSIDVDYFIL